MSTGAMIVFGLIGLALTLFITEWISNDMTAILVLVSLALLGDWTGITPREALGGFSSTATITIVAMYMLSEAIQQTGLVQYLGMYLAKFSGKNGWKALLATVGSTGPIAGFINNTPVVAVFIPMISDLADRVRISPSRLLMPLSFSAILGGTLTLIGTSTNLLASELAEQLIPGRGPIGMFEFTHLGVIILVVGIVYLMTVGNWLIPDRISPKEDLIQEFDMRDQMTRVRISENHELIGERIDEFDEQLTDRSGIEILQLVRENERFQAPYTDRMIAGGDVLTVMGSGNALKEFADTYELSKMSGRAIRETMFEEEGAVLAKFVVAASSSFAGQTIKETRLQSHHRANVLAIRRREELLRDEVDEVVLEPGDTLLLQVPPETISYFEESGELTLVDDSAKESMSGDPSESKPELDPKTPLTLLIMGTVVVLAALGLVPIVIAALGGVVAMVIAGCLTPQEAYEAVSWNIVFLLAGVIPLGLAMQKTGGDEVIGSLLASSGEVMSAIGVLFLVSLVTGLLANVITPVATVVLMTPIAVDVAGNIGAEPYSFLLAVMFASATSFMTPVGYQTNLMVYGPGEYRFTDFLLVGGPLQLLLSIVTVVGIWGFWGI